MGIDPDEERGALAFHYRQTRRHAANGFRATPRRTGLFEALLALAVGAVTVLTIGITAAAVAVPDAAVATVGKPAPVPSTSTPPSAPTAVTTTPAPVPDQAASAAPAPADPPPPEPMRGPAPEPVTRGDLAAAEASTVAISNDTCNKGGSGWVFAPGYVATNAHVVRGDTGSVELFVRGGRPAKGRVVAIDPEADVAVVHAPGLQAEPLQWSADKAPQGSAVAWIGWPDAKLTVGRGAIRMHNRAIVDGVAIDAYMLDVRGIKGMSGGPMVGPDGVVYGMNVGVADADSAAIVETGAHIAPTLRAGDGRTTPVATGTCV